MALVTIRQAERLGRDAGRNAAGWLIDGNTTDATKARIRKMIADGDPELDAAAPRPSWLSGEWAGESVNDLLGVCEGPRDDERLDRVQQAYEWAADRAFERELARLVR